MSFKTRVLQGTLQLWSSWCYYVGVIAAVNYPWVSFAWMCCPFNNNEIVYSHKIEHGDEYLQNQCSVQLPLVISLRLIICVWMMGVAQQQSCRIGLCHGCCIYSRSDFIFCELIFIMTCSTALYCVLFSLIEL